MAKLACLLIIIQCASILTKQQKKVPADFILKFMESFKKDNILIIQNMAGEYDFFLQKQMGSSGPVSIHVLDLII